MPPFRRQRPVPSLAWTLIFGLLSAAAGCETTATDATGVTDTSSGAGATQPMCKTALPSTDWSYPSGPYGSGVGARFSDFELRDCDGNPVRFSDVLGDAKVVLFNVGSGWCQPCIDEAKHLEAIYRSSCGGGLRVVQVLFQDEDGLPAPTAFCRAWRTKFGLTFPVLVDPLFETQRYFAASQTPLNLLIDRTGTIRMHTTGQVPPDLEARIAALLSE